MSNDVKSEYSMRREQFVNALSFALKAATEQDYGNAWYWLDGAGVLLQTMQNETRREVGNG